MNSTTLYPKSEPPPPAVDVRPEPLLWFERLLIVDGLAPAEKPIRDINFKPGLNVIRTEERLPSDNRTIGHSVGKTLLVRLLRYCLGERSFGTERQQKQIRSAHEDGWVIAVIHLGGEAWVIARTIGLGDEAGYSARETDVKLVQEPSDLRLPYREFIDAMDKVIAPAFNSLTLPNTHPPRRGRWLDLLAWMARDQNCRYRHHHEWRDPDSKSGTGQLTLEGAGTLIRMVMGMFAAGEEDAVEKHRLLLDRKTKLEAERNDLAHFHQIHLRELRREFSGDALSDEVDLFTKTVAQKATEKRNTLKALLKDVEANPAIAKAWNDFRSASQSLRDRRSQMTKALAMHEARTIELESKRSDAARAANDDLESLGHAFCRYYDTQNDAFESGCPGRQMNANSVASGQPSPMLLAEIRLLELSVSNAKHDADDLTTDVERLQAKETSLKDQYQSAVKAQQHHAVNIGVRIGRQGELRRMAIRTRKSWEKHHAIQESIDQTEDKIEESRTLLENLRQRLNADRATLSRIFDFVLKNLVNPEASGQIGLDARGLQPEPGDDVPTGGEAITTSATVLSFDIACLFASCCGIGQFPRLLIHDSPREADMEPQMYHSLFQLILEWESRFSGRPPNFQYIVTTTTPPPTGIDSRYIAETLSARNDNGLLFRKRLR